MRNYSLLALCLFMMMVPAMRVSAADDVTAVINADFTQFTQGSPSAPVDFPSYGTGSFSSYFPSWTVKSVAQAGGQLLIKDGGSVRTNSVNLSANSGIVRIRTQVKMMDSYGGMLHIQCGSYSSAAGSNSTLTLPDSEWHDVSLLLSGGTSYCSVTMEPMLSASGILVRNLVVEQSPSFIMAPEAYQPTQADGTSFTASWSSISGATAYLLNVYSYDGDGKVYKLQGKNVGKVQQSKVEDLDPNVTYYYTVQAVGQDATSEESNEIKVVKVISALAAPQNLQLTGGVDFVTARWEAVTDAGFYLLTLNRIIKCPTDMMVDVLDENFDKVMQGTVSSVEFIYRDNINEFTKAPGWTGDQLALAQGHMVIAPYTGLGWLSTPLLDLAGKDNNVTIDCRLANGAFGYYYPGEATMCLINAAGDTLQSKQITLSGDFADYHVTLTGATGDCRLVLMYSGDYKLYIDSFKVSQLKSAGSEVKTFLTEVETEGTVAQVNTERADNLKITATVVAGAETVYMGEITDIYSDPTREVIVDFSPGLVEGLEADAVKFEVSGREITMHLPAAMQIVITDISGKRLQSALCPVGTSVLTVDGCGVYMLRIGSRCHKILIK